MWSGYGLVGFEYPRVSISVGDDRGTGIDALSEAIERFGRSATRAEYEALKLIPASVTIMRVMGGGPRQGRPPARRRRASQRGADRKSDSLVGSLDR